MRRVRVLDEGTKVFWIPAPGIFVEWLCLQPIPGYVEKCLCKKITISMMRRSEGKEETFSIRNGEEYNEEA